MSRSPRNLLVLGDQFPNFPARLEEYAACVFSDWNSLRAHVRTASPSSVVLLRAAGTVADIEALDGLQRDTPSVPVVAAVPLAGATAAQVRSLLGTGLAEIVNVDGGAAPAALLSTLRQAHARPLKRRLEAWLPVWLSEDGRTPLRAAAEAVVDGGGREALAEIFGVYVRTVAARCVEAGLPPPRRLLGWTRVLLALSLLEEAHRTVLNVALVCGYTDNSSLKRAVENFPDSAVLGSIRDQTFAGAFEAFAEELRGLRHRDTRPRTRAGL